MDAPEKVALLLEACNQGYVISDSPEGGTSLKKIATWKNSDTVIRQDESDVLFSSIEDAINFIKCAISWEWKPTPIEVLPVLEEEIKFAAHIMFQTEIDTYSVSLGIIKHHDGKAAYEIAETRAREYFKNNLPKYNFDEIKKQIRIKPSTD